jgi:hypothetical protein
MGLSRILLRGRHNSGRGGMVEMMAVGSRQSLPNGNQQPQAAPVPRDSGEDWIPGRPNSAARQFAVLYTWRTETQLARFAIRLTAP